MIFFIITNYKVFLTPKRCVFHTAFLSEQRYKKILFMVNNYHDTRGTFYDISARFDEFYGTLQIVKATKFKK